MEKEFNFTNDETQEINIRFKEFAEKVHLIYVLKGEEFYMGDLVKFVKEIKDKYQDWMKSSFFHKLIGSTTTTATFEDFPEKEVEAFVEMESEKALIEERSKILEEATNQFINLIGVDNK
jgi:hypoxanthine-guanine phosphoribosyltransferase